MQSFRRKGVLFFLRHAIILIILLGVSNYPTSAQTPSREEIYESFLQKADSLRISGRLDEAEFAYRQALAFNENSVDALKGLGRIAYQKKDWPGYRKWFNKVLKINPEDQEAMYFLDNPKLQSLLEKADSLRAEKEFEEAEDYYEKALKIGQEPLQAYIGLGKIAYEQRDWKNIKKWFKKVLKIEPENADANYFLTTSPNPDVVPIIQKAERYRQEANNREAEKAYKQALRIYEGAFQAFRGLAQIAFEKQNFGAVKDWCKKIVEVQPFDLEANYYLGIAYRESGKTKNKLIKSMQFDWSKEYFDTVMDVDSSFQDVLYQRGLLERWKENWIEAVKWGRRQVNLKPELIQANVGLFRFYRLFLVHKNDKEVEKWLRSHIGDWSTYFLGEFYRCKKKFVQADSIFYGLLQKELTISKEPVYLSLVKSLVQQNRPEEANKYFSWALDSMKTNLDAEFLFEDSKYIFKEPELALFRSLALAEHKRNFFRSFWNSRNPVLASPVNYRALEHFKRLIYAEENYWFDGVRFWATNPDKVGYFKFPRSYFLNQEFNDKGMIYLHHGEPDQIAKTQSTATSNESWLYYERENRPKLIFHFVIEERFGTGNNWRLTPVLTDRDMLQDRTGWDPKLDRMLLTSSRVEFSSLQNQLADESRETVNIAMSSDFHTWDEAVEFLDIPYYMASFRGGENLTRLEIYYGIPLLALSSSNQESSPIFEHGTGIYDMFWNPKKRFYNKGQLDSVDSDQVSHNYFVNRCDIGLRPGTYNLSIYSKVIEPLKLGTITVRTEVPSYRERSLSMSDLELAYDIASSDENSIFNTNDLSIIPNPTKEYFRKEPVHVYFEIYQLSKDEQGGTRFEVEYKLTLLKKKKGVFKKIFGFLDGGKKKSISIKETRTGKQETSVEYRTFDVSNLDSGEYELTVRVKDLTAGSVVEKSINVALR
ncbi:MAG: tetratricopeptide repeat protein [bacterium]